MCVCVFHSLVAGNVNGRLKTLFAKVNNVLKKTGQFDVSGYFIVTAAIVPSVCTNSGICTADRVQQSTVQATV